MLNFQGLRLKKRLLRLLIIDDSVLQKCVVCKFKIQIFRIFGSLKIVKKFLTIKLQKLQFF